MIPPGGGSVSTPIGFFAERSVNQTIPSTSQVVIDTDLVIWEDPVGTFDLTNNRFTCTVDGIYVFCLSVDIAFGGFNTYGICALRVNGTIRTDEMDETNFDDVIRMGNSFCFGLVAGDYVDAVVYNGDVFAATLSGCQNQFSGALISPT
jgi:hypothetical protein